MSNDYKNGQSDANKGHGMKSPNSHASSQAREKYEAGYNHAKQQQKKKR